MEKKNIIPLIPRVVCSCGWYNNQPSEQKKRFAKCRNCGKPLDKKELFKYELSKRLKKLNQF